MNDALLADPPSVVTVITPVAVPTGTEVKIEVADNTLKVAAIFVVVVLPVKVTEVAPVRLVPVIVTEVPTPPEVGLIAEIVGAAAFTVNVPALVAVNPPLVTLIAPVVTPIGATAVIDVAETTVNEVAFKPLNLTAVAVVKLVPVMVIVVPVVPLVGVNDAIDRTLKVAEFEVAEPTPLVNTARYCLPLSAATGVKV